MQKITTNTFQITIDERFSIVAKNHEFFTLADNFANFELQTPMLNMALSEIKDLKEFGEEDHYKELLFQYFKGKRANLQLPETMVEQTIADKEALVQVGYSTFENEKGAVKIHHYFINIPLDDEFMLEISVDCEAGNVDTHLSLMWNAIHSLEFLGNYRQHIDAQNKAVEERLAALEKRLAAIQNKTAATPTAVKSLEIPSFKPPKNGENIARIGDFKVEISSESKINAGRELFVELALIFNDLDKAIDQQLFTQYAQDIIKITFHTDNVYQNQQPKGVFTVEKGKTSTHKYLRISDLDYGLQFDGQVVFDNNRLGILGNIHSEHKHNKVFPVEIYWYFNAEHLNWSDYYFSWEEAQQAPKNEVQHLQIFNPKLERYPAEIVSYKNLKTLSIIGKQPGRNGYDSNDASVIHSIPESLGTLRDLEEIYFGNLAITSIPESIAQLPKLKRLSVNACPLQHIPDGVFQLTSLEHLTLNGALTELPETANLPNLKSLSVANNQLKTLPESYANLEPNYFYIKNNPFTSLPEAFKDVPTDLSFSEKQRLFDWEYKSKNTADIDTALFNLSHYTKEKAALAIAIDAFPVLSRYKDFLLEVAKMATYLVLEEAKEDIAIGASKVGGAPDLPEDMAHPANEKGELYIFQAQINCEDAAAFQSYLPRTGMLYFFVNTEEYAEKPVILYHNKKEKLKRFTYTEQHNWIDYDHTFSDLRPAKAVAFENAVSIPDFYNAPNYFAQEFPEYAQLFHIDANDNEAWKAFDKVLDAVQELTDQLNTPGWSAKQNKFGSHKCNAYVFTQHESPEAQAATKFGGKPNEWLAILCMESVGDFNFWDAGTLTYCVHKKDLAIQQFETVHSTIESS